MRLLIGSRQRPNGWQTLDITPGPQVDFVGSCVDLSPISTGSVDEVYASHVLEHLGYIHELPAALGEIHRVLKQGGVLRLSVPDLEILCHLFIDDRLDVAAKFHVMRIMFGGQTDVHDVHKVGLSWPFAVMYLTQAGFGRIERVDEHGLFDDSSSLRVAGELISLNVVAVKVRV